MKEYVIQLIIREGYDEFWEELTANNKSGCDEILQEVKDCFAGTGLDFDMKDIKIIKYTDE